MDHSSYRRILKSSALIGGSSVLNVLLGIVRTKVLAVLIGANGMGLFGALSSLTTLAGGIAGMGINASGIRQIAEAAGTSDQQGIARTAFVLRRTSLALGFVGMLGLLILCRPISKATFGDTSYAGAIALVSLAVLFTTVAAGEVALIQGLRRIRDLAALSVWSATLSTVVSLPIIYLFRERGIAPFLLAVSLLSIATSWWYARKVVEIDRTPLQAPAVWREAKALLGMGVVFMLSGLMGNGVAYLTRVIVIKQMGIEAAGLYQAAWTLSSVYVGFVLGAMGADYYPRLTTVARDNAEVNRLVSEQTEASLLMSLPGILGTLAFAPWVIHLLYSAAFEPAGDVLRWQILGTLGRVVSWPLGFVLLAKGRARSFLCTELASNVVHLGLIWLGLKWFGLSGLGMAFLGLYVFYGLLVLIVVRRLTGFRWTTSNLQLGGGALIATALVFLATGSGLPIGWGKAIGGLATGIAVIYAVSTLIRRAGYVGVGDAFLGIRNRIRVPHQ